MLLGCQIGTGPWSLFDDTGRDSEITVMKLKYYKKIKLACLCHHCYSNHIVVRFLS